MYGGTEGALPISLDHNEIFHQLKRETFHSSILTMNLDGKKQQVLLRDLQMHPYKRKAVHLDFQRVDASNEIHVKVPLHFINGEIAPGVKLQGGMVSHVINELDVTCLAADLPAFIEVDLKDLAAGHSIKISDLTMPKGVEPFLHKGEDPVVASILLPKGTATEEEEAAAEAPAGAAAAAVPPAAPASPAKPSEKK